MKRRPGSALGFLAAGLCLCLFSGAARASHGWDSLPAPARWVASASVGAEEVGYHLHRAAPGTWVGHNAAHSIDMAFSPDGTLEVGTSGGEELRLRLERYGRGSAQVVLAGVRSRHVDRNRLRQSRGPVTEVYVNGPAGLAQGFVLERPPQGTAGRADGRAAPVYLSLSVGGDLQASGGGADGDGILFGRHPASPVLRYTGLAAWDATGRPLPVRWSGRGAAVRFEIDDRGAAYPLTVDPFLVQHAKLTASDGTTSNDLGAAVAVSGNVVVVGAPLHDTNGDSNRGAVYVFERPGSGWADMTQTAKLTASDGALGDQLGAAVAIDGDVIVAGAPLHQVGANAGQGAVYVFERPGSGWTDMTETAKLTASDGAAADDLGRSVAVRGTVVAAGAPLHDTGGNSGQGAVYVFERPGSGWTDMTETAKLTASDGAAFDELGASLSMDGDTLVAGARFDDGVGSAYVFVKPPSGWSDGNETAKLTPSDGASGDQFGTAVAISGDTVLVGAPRRDVKGNVDQGVAYVFVKPAGGWVDMTETAELTASDGASGDRLGEAVALDGITALLGAPFHEVNGNAQQGAVYEIVKAVQGWTKALELSKLVAADGIGNDHFGFAVGLETGTAVVGAPQANVAGNTDQGAAYVFAEQPAVPPPGCPAAPQTGCLTPGKSILKLEDKSLADSEPERADRLVWKWLKGPAVSLAQLGDPVSGATSYSLCIYDETAGAAALHSSYGVPSGGTCAPGKPCWKALGSATNIKGFRYKDKLAFSDGTFKVLLKSGDAGKSKVLVVGKGANLGLPGPVGGTYLQQDTHVIVQLRSNAGTCWEARFPAPAVKNDGERFLDKAP